MFNILDELRIGMAAREKQERLAREIALRNLYEEAKAHREGSRNGRASWVQFLALALKALGTNGQLNWKL